MKIRQPISQAVRSREPMGLAVLAAIVVTQGLLFGWGPVDDAYISYRYARNLAQGHGLVFNPGEYVEGYTNFLWTVLLAGAARLHVDVPAASMVLGMVFACLSLWLTLRLAQRIGRQRDWPAWLAWLAPILLACYPGWSYWALAGLEGPLLTFLVLGLLLLAYDSQASSPQLILASLVAVLAALTRLEVVLLCPVAAAVQLADGSRPYRQRVFRVLMASSIVAGCLAAHVLWRHQYYGHWLPNTYYAKVGGPFVPRLQWGLAYVVELSITWLVPLTLIVWVRRSRQSLSNALVATLGIYCLYAVWAGGDHFPWLRFYLPVLPIAAILLVEAAKYPLEDLTIRTRQAPAAALTCAVAVLLVTGISCMDLPAAQEHRLLVEHWKAVGSWAAQRLPPSYRVVLAPVGAVAYYGNQPVLDVLGLTDHETAHHGQIDPREVPGHQKSHIGWIFRSEPQIVLGQAVLFREPPLAADAVSVCVRSVLKKLYAMPEFQELYRYEVARVGQRYLPLWVRRDLPSIGGTR